MKKIWAVLLTSVVACLPIASLGAETNVPKTYSEDFYEAVNKEWLKEATIKPGYAKISNFTTLSDVTREQIATLFDEILAHSEDYDRTDRRAQMVCLYNNFLNQAARNTDDYEPIRPHLEALYKVTTIEELGDYFKACERIPFNPYLGLEIGPDLKDSTKKRLTLTSGTLLLKDADHYTKPTAQSVLQKEATTAYAKTLLQLVGNTEEEALKKIERVYGLETELAKSMYGTEGVTTHPNIYEATYNLYTKDQLQEAAGNVPILALMKVWGYGEIEEDLIVQEPKWLETFSTVYNEANLEAFKDMAELKILMSTARYLSEPFEQAVKAYQANLNGIVGDMPREQEAFTLVNNLFSEEMGQYYVEKYFSEAEKQDLLKLVEEIIATYKIRLQELNWMSDSTKEHALKKLETMGVKIGYPDEWEPLEGLNLKSYAAGGSLVDNLLDIQKCIREQEIRTYKEPVNKRRFHMAPQTVNACYSPLSNDITFPAALLQAPFYDKDRKAEANMGAIGIIIAHEITHAFDNHGARFDEKGCLSEWWEKEDYKKFEKLSQKVRDYFSKIEILPEQYVNGDLTVGENIADIGAMACMLDVLAQKEDPDYEAFFESWATVWRMKATDEYTAQMLLSDPHAPGKIRVNEVVKQFEPFYKTYNIKKKDSMYLAPRKRLHVW